MIGLTNTQILNHKEGRLGNQLFRVATIIGESEKKNIDYFIPKEWEHVEKFPNLKNVYSISDINKNITNHYSEPKFGFNEIPYNGGLLSIHGYFQSYKFFEGVEDKIIDSFRFYSENTEMVKYNFNSGKKRLCVHVRHGDFYDRNTGGGHKGNENYHPVMTLKYYENALNFILDRTKIDEILVFTDHPETKDFIVNEFDKFNLPLVYFDYSDDYFSDFISQTLCDHFIIPNSTFSWWSSFLSTKNDNKIVCCPNENDWLGVSYSNFDVSTLLPPSWFRIPQN